MFSRWSGAEVLDLMGELQLFGMRNAYDEILATALRALPPRAAARRPANIVCSLLLCHHRPCCRAQHC
jgi:hypothetical protein